MRGSLVFNEVIMPIVDVRLRDGTIIFVGRAQGPFPAFEGGETDVRVVGEDGIDIGTVRLPLPKWEGGKNSEWTVTADFPIRLLEVMPE